MAKVQLTQVRSNGFSLFLLSLAAWLGDDGGTQGVENATLELNIVFSRDEGTGMICS